MMARRLVRISLSASHWVSSSESAGGGGQSPVMLTFEYSSLCVSPAAELRSRIGLSWIYAGGSGLGERRQMLSDSGNLMHVSEAV